MRAAKWMIALTAAGAALVVPEVGLRLAGFEWDPGPVIQFGWPQPEHLARMRVDEDLFWTLEPDGKFANSLGFPAREGREVEMPKPERSYRILFFGDSVTFGGYPSYVEDQLNETQGGPERSFEAVALAVVGYSSFQGLRCAQKYAEAMQPDLAVLYYGWNDHWLARGTIDSEKVMRVPAEDEEERGGLMRHSRFAQWAAKLVRESSGTSNILDVPRVSPDEYGENLKGIFEIVDGLGAPVILITAPTSYYQLGVHSAVVEVGQIQSVEEAIRVHRAYNRVVREVAAETGALLLDLEPVFDARSDLAEIFRPDGIHFVEEGKKILARYVTDFIAEHALSNH